jgi:Holliday junction resolvase RusA-like endonuclease
MAPYMMKDTVLGDTPVRVYPNVHLGVLLCCWSGPCGLEIGSCPFAEGDGISLHREGRGLGQFPSPRHATSDPEVALCYKAQETLLASCCDSWRTYKERYVCGWRCETINSSHSAGAAPTYHDSRQCLHVYRSPYEATLGQLAALHMRSKPPTANPVALLVHAFLRVPESWSKREREAALAGAILPTSRPDGDNFLKICQDSLNKICYLDDSQIVDARVIKRYDEKPGLRIEIKEFVPKHP